MADLSRLGKYIIRRELGRGAMGVVYEGFDPVIERTVAIKTIRTDQVEPAQMGDLLARFKREAQAAGRLNHPHIVAIYEYGEDIVGTARPAPDPDATVVETSVAAGSRIAFIAMEFIKGRELKDYFDENRRFPIKETGRIMGEMLAALAHAHSHGVTHRDMKPANVILLDGGAAVKVADFGIARIETSELTQAGTVLGTPSYMSPEQFLGQVVDGRSDLFSCGVILYQFLTGEKPFTGAVTTIMHKVLKEEPLAPSMLNATLPPAWDTVMRKAMAKNPDDRFQTAGEFAQAIADVVAGKAAADATMIDLGESTFAGSGAASVRAGENRPEIAANAANATGAAGATPVGAAGTGGEKSRLVMVGVAAAVAALAGMVFVAMPKKTEAPQAASAPSVPTPAPTGKLPTVAVAQPQASQEPADPAPEPGMLTISALGLADPAKYNGDAAAAGNEARADAKRQLIEKALGLYVAQESLNKNYDWVRQKMLSRSGEFIKTTLSEDAPQTGRDGLVAIATRATVRVRDLQKSLNEMSEKERIVFIRNNGDPKISVEVLIRNADSSQPIPPARSQVAENMIKERIKSFGFRVWSAEGEAKTGASAKPADFHIVGEVKVKVLSAKLAASGLTITKTALTAWTIKAIDKSSGEEIYVNTTMPKNTSWPNEDAALADIGKLVGDEFSKNFFLARFNFDTQRVNLTISGLPDDSGAILLRELRGLRLVLDAKQIGPDKFVLELPEGSASDLISTAVAGPINAKLGQPCLTLAGTSGADVTLAYAPACAVQTVRGKFESEPPAGLLSAPDGRTRAVRKVA